MTEGTLEKAIMLKKKIDNLRSTKKEFEEARKLCWGNTGEVNSRIFRLYVEKGCRDQASVVISADAAMVALDRELRVIEEELAALEIELDAL